MPNREANSFERGGPVHAAVAIDKDKNSQLAVRWAIDNLKLRDNQIVLVHVRLQNNHDQQYVPKEGREPTQAEMQQLFLPFRSFCARKGIRAKEVILHDIDVAGALSEYVSHKAVAAIVLGASSRNALARAFKNADVPSNMARYAPDTCSVYVVSKGKVSEVKSATKAPPSSSPHHPVSSDASVPSKFSLQASWKSAVSEMPSSSGSKSTSPVESANTSYESAGFGSNFSSPQNTRAGNGDYGHMIPPIRNPGNNKIATLQQSMNHMNLLARSKDSPMNSVSGSSDNSGIMSFPSDVSFDILDQPRYSDSSRSSTSSQAAELEEELRRLKQELKQVTEMYNGACKEAVTARGQVRDIVQWQSEEGRRVDDAKQVQENAFAILEREKQKYKAAVEVAQMAQRVAELESEKRKRAEMRYKQESEEKQKAIDALAHSETRYRRYTFTEIEVATSYFAVSEKIGEGGYGPVYKATLDHTDVAIKVLRPDISQGHKQFQREVEVLSRMRHPNMVILLGACPEYGCLVYEYLENGSLEDRLFCRDGTPPLSWSSRFRIAAEIATALNFLHRTRPEPLVHRDLKPANILLDKYFGSKISDVGLSRLVPSSSADSVTQYHMTAAAGTFCYIDPEYQQTGMLGTKSDIYSLGVLLLQIITAKPAMGLTHHVEIAIETGKFAEILDQNVQDWPVEAALSLAKLALKCCELRRRDRPDLDTVILPELERLRNLGSQTKPEDRLSYMYSQVQSFQESSFASQMTSSYEAQSKYASGSGSSTITSDMTD